MATTNRVHQSGDTIMATDYMVIQNCYSCGLLFAVSKYFNDLRLRDHKSFSCPAGHWQSYTGKTAEQKLREQLAETERQRDAARAGRTAARDQAAASERSARAFKGHLTRMRNRIANGVCPVQSCQRHFANVHQHITKQHPEWAAEHPSVMGGA